MKIDASFLGHFEKIVVNIIGKSVMIKIAHA